MSDTLLIDIGNTNLKWAWSSNLSAIESVSHIEQDAEQLIAQCWQNMRCPERVLIANVAGLEKERIVSEWVQEHWRIPPEFVSSTPQAAGVVNGYRNPSQLGVDRWLTLLAVKNRYQKAACIVDCGTAITIDMVDETGLHWGGLILPGLRLMREAIFEKTHIPRSEKMEAEGLWAKDSHSAIASASLNAAVALVEKVMHQSEAKLGALPELVLTGRDADAVAKELDLAWHIVPDLVMQGLCCLSEEAV